jgi:hypothetical protein
MSPINKGSMEAMRPPTPNKKKKKTLFLLPSASA